MENTHLEPDIDVRQLGLEVDGLPLIGGSEPSYALRAAIEALSPAFDEVFSYLRALGRHEVAILDEFFDPVGELLDGLGVGWRRIAAEDLTLEPVRLVFVGCNHRNARLDSVDLEPFLARGGVIVTSDRAATLSGLQPYLPTCGGRAARRARIALTSPIGDGVPGPVTPAAWLEPGHHPLSEGDLSQSDSSVLARDTLTGDPLVVRVEVGSGSILHAVPHWYQSSPTSSPTGLESRLLKDVPCYAAIGNSYPRLSLGAFLSMRAMLHALLLGIAQSAGIPIVYQKNQTER
ncbi:MAG: hypothetical protein ACOC9Y_04295 [Chloroflexota bacterium]